MDALLHHESIAFIRVDIVRGQRTRAVPDSLRPHLRARVGGRETTYTSNLSLDVRADRFVVGAACVLLVQGARVPRDRHQPVPVELKEAKELTVLNAFKLAD